MRNEHDANLSLRPMTHKDWERVINCPASKIVKRAPAPRPGVSLPACLAIVSLFAGAGVALALFFS